MTSVEHWLPDAGWPRFACDVLWQSTLVGAAAWCVLRWLVRHPALRAGVAVSSVALMLLAPVVSWSVRSAGYGLLTAQSSAVGAAVQPPAVAPVPMAPANPTGQGPDASPVAGSGAEPAPGESPLLRPEAVAARGTAFGIPADPLQGDDAAPAGWRWLAWGWGLLSLVFGIRLLIGVGRLVCICRAARVCHLEQLVAIGDKAAGRIGLRRRPIVMWSSHVTIPAIIAFGRPRLLIPDRCDERPDSEWLDIFCHELAHVRRRDGWSLLLMEVSRAILPWQPLVRWLGREHSRACEDACDDWVVSTGSDPLDFATSLTNWIPRRAPGLLIGFGGRSVQTTQRVARLIRIDAAPQPALSGGRTAGIIASSALLGVAIALTQSGAAAVSTANARVGTTGARPLPGLVPAPESLPEIGNWQVATRDPQGHTTSIAWSPDSRQIAFAEAGNIRIHDAETMELVRILVGHTAMVRSVAWSPDGNWLATCGDDQSVRLWSADGRPGAVIQHHSGPVMSVSWSPSSRFFASASADRTVRVWDLIGSSAGMFDAHTAAVRAVAWSPTDEWIASAGDDKTVRLWNWRTGTQQSRTGHTFPVTCLAWHADGTQLVSGDANPAHRYERGAVRVWHVNGNSGASYTKSVGGCAGLAWLEHGNSILVTGAQGWLERWRPGDARGDYLAGATAELECVAVSPDQRQVAAGGIEDPLCVWSIDGVLHQTLKKRYGQTIWSLSWSPAGTPIAAGDNRGAVQLWDADGSPGPHLRMDEDGVERRHWALQALDWSPDGTRLVAGAADTALYIWSAAGERGTKLTAGGDHLVCAAWSPDGSKIAVAGMDPDDPGVRGGGKSPAWVGLWDADGTRGHQFDPLPHNVESLAWSPDSRQVVAGCFDGSVRIWSTDGQAGPRMQGHDSWVISVDWSPDGQWIASAGVDRQIRLWRPDGTPGPILRGHTGDIRSIAWSPNSEWLASASWDNTVRLWKPDGTAGPILAGHASWVYSVTWSPDSERIVSGSLDGTIRIWNRATEQTEWIGFALPTGELISLTASGTILHGDPGAVDREFVYLVESATGATDLFSPSEFQQRVGGPR